MKAMVLVTIDLTTSLYEEWLTGIQVPDGHYARIDRVQISPRINGAASAMPKELMALVLYKPMSLGAASLNNVANHTGVLGYDQLNEEINVNGLTTSLKRTHDMTMRNTLAIQPMVVVGSEALKVGSPTIDVLFDIDYEIKKINTAVAVEISSFL